MTKTIRIALIILGCATLAIVDGRDAENVGLLRADAPAPAVQPFKELTLDLGDNVTMKLVLIPAGKFTMGSDRSIKDEPSKGSEAPAHEVTISKPFYMSIYPVTQGQYQQVMQKRSAVPAPMGPIMDVSWFQAVEFCDQLSMKIGKV